MRRSFQRQIPAATGTREFRRFLLVAQLEAKEIGERIAQARKEAGLTQEQLIQLATFSQRSLSDYERGAVIPYRQMREISKLLDRPVEWFLHGDDEDEPAVLERLDSIDGRLARIEAALALSLPAEAVEALRAEGRGAAAAAAAAADRLDLLEHGEDARRERRTG